MHITRQHILSKVSTFDILKHFLNEYYERENAAFKPGVHVYVPEISGEQKSPSFNIYPSRTSNEYRYKDFTGHDGSCFDLVMNLYGVNFPEALKIINKEMNLGLDDEKVDYSKIKPKAEPKIKVERNYNYKLITGKWTKRKLKYWAAFGTGIKTLEKYNYKPLEQLNYFNRYNIPKEIKSGSNSLIFVFERDGWGKWYMPEIKGVQKKAFGYFGEKPIDYVFGMEQLPETGDDLYLISGEKDTLNMHSHGYNAVCLNSEESTPKNYPKFMELLESGRFKNYYCLYDADSTGRRQMLNISNEIPQIKMKLLDLDEGDDISDYLKKKYNKLMF